MGVVGVLCVLDLLRPNDLLGLPISKLIAKIEPFFEFGVVFPYLDFCVPNGAPENFFCDIDIV